jgi:hypothetical protein
MRSPGEVLSGGTTIRHLFSEDEVSRPVVQDEACRWIGASRARMLAMCLPGLELPSGLTQLLLCAEA